MHMADALVSPAVGGLMTAASAGLLWYSARNLKKNFDPSRVPLMGVMGAFVFAAQMINFTIPGTGSSRADPTRRSLRRTCPVFAGGRSG